MSCYGGVEFAMVERILKQGLRCRIWAIYKKGVYDLSDYFNTIDLYGSASGEGVPNYKFLNEGVSKAFKEQPGADATKDVQDALDSMSSEDAARHVECLKNVFYVGEVDFREEARCTVQNWILLSFSIVMMATVVAKCE